jgi:hypothetical protein
MPKCPYCKVGIHLDGFFDVVLKETINGKIIKELGEFKGEQLNIGLNNKVRMWCCPSCDRILGFSEYTKVSV